MRAQKVYENLDEGTGRTLGMAALGAALSFGSPHTIQNGIHHQNIENIIQKEAKNTIRDLSEFKLDSLEFDSLVRVFFDTSQKFESLVKENKNIFSDSDNQHISFLLNQLLILTSQIDPLKIIPGKKRSSDDEKSPLRTGRRPAGRRSGGKKPKGGKELDKLVKMIKAWLQAVKVFVIEKFFKK